MAEEVGRGCWRPLALRVGARRGHGSGPEPTGCEAAPSVPHRSTPSEDSRTGGPSLRLCLWAGWHLPRVPRRPGSMRAPLLVLPGKAALCRAPAHPGSPGPGSPVAPGAERPRCLSAGLSPLARTVRPASPSSSGPLHCWAGPRHSGLRVPWPLRGVFLRDTCQRSGPLTRSCPPPCPSFIHPLISPVSQGGPLSLPAGPWPSAQSRGHLVPVPYSRPSSQSPGFTNEHSAAADLTCSDQRGGCSGQQRGACKSHFRPKAPPERGPREPDRPRVPGAGGACEQGPCPAAGLSHQTPPPGPREARLPFRCSAGSREGPGEPQGTQPEGLRPG